MSLEHSQHLNDHMSAANICSGLRPAMLTQSPTLKTQVEQVSIVRSPDGRTVAMSFINANSKFVSTVAPVDTQIQTSLNQTFIQTVLINRTGEPCMVTTRNGAQLLSNTQHSASTRMFIVRQIYSFPDQACIKAFVDQMSQVHGSIRTAAADLLLQQAKSHLENRNRFGPYQIVVDHRIPHTALEAQSAVYDPNTDLVIALKSHHDKVMPHPGCDQGMVEKAFSEFCPEEAQSYSQHLIKVCVTGTQTKGLYYKALGAVHRVETNTAQPPMHRFMNGQLGEEILSDYVELYSNRPSVILKHEGDYITHQSTEHKEPVLVYRISLEEARTRMGLFDSALLAETNGDPDKVDAVASKANIAALEAEILNLKRQDAIQKNMWSQEDHEREIAKIKVQAEKDREEEIRRLNAERLRLEEELKKAHLNRTEQELKIKHAQVEADQKQRHAETNHRHSQSDHESKSSIEGIKLAAAGIGLAVVVATAIVKLSSGFASASLFAPAAALAVGATVLSSVSSTISSGISDAWSTVKGWFS
jgi:hypothetical protein